MKVVDTVVNEIERIGISVDQQFTINFDSKMAKILADGLYSDKIKSVIRELSCNAWDSHVEAGKQDTPIEVHFPNRFEPWYHVRDFGVGLSHDQVMSIYTRYGASTKTNSNEVIGQLGLGSKSPFALTDAFTVTTRKDGIENHYSMYRDERGMPCVAKLSENPTTESNGVTVTVPVRADQQREFMDKACDVYKWFPVKPVIVGDTVKYDQVEYEYQGDDWGIRKPTVTKNSYYYNRQSESPVALMGLVAYPLDSNSINGLSKGVRELFATPFVLRFDIGDLEVAANREALGYDERTCANIVAKAEKMLTELGEQFEKEIAESKTEWEARCKFGDIFSRSEYSSAFTYAFRHKGLKWRNKEIKSDDITVDLSTLYPKSVDSLGHTVADIQLWEVTGGLKRPRKVRSSYGYSNNLVVRCSENKVVMFNDLALGGPSRVAEYHKANGYNKHVYLFGESTVADWVKIRKALGNPEVIMTSSLPKPVRAKVERTNMLKWKGVDGAKKAWDTVSIDLNDGGFYVELNGWDVLREDGKTQCDLLWYVKSAKEAGILPNNVEIYAMRLANKKAVREHGDWKELFAYIKEQVTKKIVASNLAQEIADGEEVSSLTNIAEFPFWRHYIPVKAEHSLFKKFTAKVMEMSHSSNSSTVYTIKSLANRFSVDLGTAEPKYKLVLEYKQIMVQYPMLQFVRNRYNRYSTPNGSELEEIAKYINYVDTCDPFYRMQEETPA